LLHNTVVYNIAESERKIFKNTEQNKVINLKKSLITVHDEKHSIKTMQVDPHAIYFDRLPMYLSQTFADALLRVRGCAFKGVLSGNISLSKTVSGFGNTKTDQTETL
jgi:hypothetical protein